MSQRQTKSDYKLKLSQMGVSLDRTDHPLNYYKQMYLEKSNAKNKVTRNDTPFYHEQIMNKKRQRSSSKKNKSNKHLDFNEEVIDEQNEDDDFDTKYNTKDIKTTRLIESKKKKKSYKNEELNEEQHQKRKVDRMSAKAMGGIVDIKDENNLLYKHNYNLRSKPNTQLNEKNIINVGAQNKNYNKNNNKINDKKIKTENTPQKDYYLNVNENIKEPEEKPEIITKKKYLLRRQNDIINEEKEPKLDQYRPVEDNNIITYNNENKEINMEMENNNINNNINYIPDNMIQENTKENQVNSETSSFVSNTTSRFSRFSNFTFMSLSRIGSNIVNMKNSIMNKFRRNAYLFPLVILILFGILFFLNEKYENFERNNIIIIFSVIMGVIILFHLFKCLKERHNYRKMAKEDKKKLFEKFDINKENLNELLLDEFIRERIRENGISEETYIKYVFPHLVKYLKKDGFYLIQRKK